MEIRGIKIGDKFKRGNITNEVVDFYQVQSMVTFEILGYNCIARGVDTISKNTFEVPFVTVQRFKINIKTIKMEKIENATHAELLSAKIVAIVLTLIVIFL